MGNKGSKGSKSRSSSKSVTKSTSATPKVYKFVPNPDQYRSLGEVQEALQKAGLESSNRNLHFLEYY
jgi:hypothetical protein